jgi:hypothetical protein
LRVVVARPAPPQLSAGLSPADGEALGRCLLPLLPPLASAGVDINALASCSGIFGGTGAASASSDDAEAPPGGAPTSTDGGAGALTALAFGADLSMSAPVRYSAPCAALQSAAGVAFSPAWLSGAAARCLRGAGCDPGCLAATRDFLRAFASAGCVDEYFAALRSQRSASSSSPPTSTGTAAYAAAASAATAATRVALAEKVVNSLLPAIASSADDLACTRNAAGAYCLAFTGALPGGAAGGVARSGAPAPSGAASAATSAALSAASAAGGANDPDPAIRCAYWARMGCCAPLVASLGLRAAAAVTTSLGFDERWDGEWSTQEAALASALLGGGGGGATAPPPAAFARAQAGGAATATAVRAALAELNDRCWRLAALNVSLTPCGGADSYLDAAAYAAPPQQVTHWYVASGNGGKRLSGVAIAAIVIVVLLVFTVCGARMRVLRCDAMQFCVVCAWG